jgi:hypothetical protein
MERVAPRQVAYENQLPLAIESKSQRRKFFPEGATTYGPNGNTNGHPNIIRIPINADSLLDVQHSYLQFTINNLDGARTLGFDVGLPFIRRMRVESAGTTLEDIDNYGKLFGAVLFPSQASAGSIAEYNTAGMGISQLGANLTDITATASPAIGANATAIGATNGGDESANIVTAINALRTRVQDAITAHDLQVLAKVNAMTAQAFVGAGHDNNNTLSVSGGATPSKTFSVCLHSGLFNMEKYLPLVMMNAGLVLELEIDVPNAIGITDGAADCNYSITDVAYYGHLIDLQRDFYDRLRMVMEGSGGVLQLTGTTFRSFTSNHNSGAGGTYNVSIPARMKSIKSIFFTHTATDKGGANGQQHFQTGVAIPNGVSEYQFRVGSVVYPAQPVKAGVSNKGEAYQELRKAFGTLGDYSHGGVLLNSGSYYLAADTDHPQALGANVLTPYGLDFESFPKTTLENGINSADRSLPITLEIKRSGGLNQAVDVDVFVMCDAVFYVNLDGSVSVSV